MLTDVLPAGDRPAVLLTRSTGGDGTRPAGRGGRNASAVTVICGSFTWGGGRRTGAGLASRTRPAGLRELHGLCRSSFDVHRSHDATARAVQPGAGVSAVCAGTGGRSEEHTSELQSRPHLVCRL